MDVLSEARVTAAPRPEGWPAPRAWRSEVRQSRPEGVGPFPAPDPMLADRAYWAIPGKVMGVQFPADLTRHLPEGGTSLTERDGTDVAAAHARLDAAYAAGIRHLVAFIDPAEFSRMGWRSVDEARLFVRGHGISLSVQPTTDLTAPTHAAMDAALDEMDAHLAAGEGVAIACRGGIGRTSVGVGSLLIRHGYTTPARVVEDIGRLRSGIGDEMVQPMFPAPGSKAGGPNLLLGPQTPVQVDFLRERRAGR